MSQNLGGAEHSDEQAWQRKQRSGVRSRNGAESGDYRNGFEPLRLRLEHGAAFLPPTLRSHYQSRRTNCRTTTTTKLSSVEVLEYLTVLSVF